MKYPTQESVGGVTVRRLAFDNVTFDPIEIDENHQDISIGDLVVTFYKVDLSMDVTLSNEVSVGVCAGKVIRPLQRNTPLIDHPIDERQVYQSLTKRYPELISWVKFETDHIESILLS